MEKSSALRLDIEFDRLCFWWSYQLNTKQLMGLWSIFMVMFSTASIVAATVLSVTIVVVIITMMNINAKAPLSLSWQLLLASTTTRPWPHGLHCSRNRCPHQCHQCHHHHHHHHHHHFLLLHLHLHLRLVLHLHIPTLLKMEFEGGESYWNFILKFHFCNHVFSMINIPHHSMSLASRWK